MITALTMGYLVDRYHRIPRPLYQLGSLVILIGLFFGLTFISTTNKGGLMALIILSTVRLLPIRSDPRKSTDSAFSSAPARGIPDHDLSVAQSVGQGGSKWSMIVVICGG